MKKPRKLQPGIKLRDADKVRKIPLQDLANDAPQRKPEWIRIKLPTGAGAARVQNIKKLLREHRLATVCEEASCPNLGECFSGGTATFMIMGDICTRRCSFCDVAHGRPNPLDPHEPDNLAKAIAALGLRYVVMTSVDRDDLEDGGAQHFVDCIRAARARSPQLKVEILVPDFRTCQAKALEILAQAPPDIFNHNLETVPRLYKTVRPGANYQQSLDLLKQFTNLFPAVPGKSGLMLGIGEKKEEVVDVLKDLRRHGVTMLTLGQYLQPSPDHLRVERYITPDEFQEYRKMAEEMGFRQVASGAMVRSSYHAEIQAGLKTDQV